MNRANLRTEIQRMTGRNDSGFDSRINEAINRALRQWGHEHPWDSLRTIETITHPGGRTLVFPRFVDRAVWLVDKTNQRAVEAATRQWDREETWSLAQSYVGYADSWEPAGYQAVCTNVTNSLSIRSSSNSDNLTAYITGTIRLNGSTETVDTYVGGEPLTLSGATGVTTTSSFLTIDSINLSDYPAGVVQVRCGSSVVGVIGPYDKESRYFAARLMDIPSASTAFMYGAVRYAPPLISDSQAPPPCVDPDFILWHAASDIHWQLHEGERYKEALGKASRILNDRMSTERLGSDQGLRIVPWDGEDDA